MVARARAAFWRDVIERPAISPFFGGVLGVLGLFLGFLTLSFSAGGAVNCGDAPAIAGIAGAGREGVIPVEWGYLTLILVAALALTTGWEPILRRPVRGVWLRIMDWYRAQSLGPRVALVTVCLPVLVPILLLRAFARICSFLFSLADFLLAQIVARLAGATIGAVLPNMLFAALARYVIGGFWILGGAAVGYLAPAPYGLIGVAVGVVAVFGIVRRWSWVEADREAFLAARRYDPRTMRVGFLEDLRDEALTALVFLFLLVPLGLRQVHLSGDAFQFVEAAGGVVSCRIGQPSLLDWVGFFGAELMKAAPVVDWSEVFEVENGSPIRPTTAFGAQLVFFLRVALDLVLLGSVVQAVQIATRLRDQNAAFEAGMSKILDPFSEGRRLYAIGSAILPAAASREREGRIGARSVMQPAEELPPYDPGRLAQIAGVEDHFPEVDAPVAGSFSPVTRDEMVRVAALAVLVVQHGQLPQTRAAVAALAERDSEASALCKLAKIARHLIFRAES